MAGNNGPKIVTNGLVLALDAADRKSYSGSGTAWNDLSGNGNSATLGGNCVYNSSNGGGIVFDGSFDQVISNSSIININNAGTVSLWLKHTSGGNQNFTQRYFSLNNERLVIRRQSNQFMMYVNTNTSGGVTLSFLYVNNSFVFGEIFNIVARWDGTAMKIFKNATEVGSVNVSGTVSENNLTYYLSANFPGGDESLNGTIYSVLYYNKSLSSSEILQNFNATRGRFQI